MNSLVHKYFIVPAFYVLTGVILLYIAIEIIELLYLFGKALIIQDDNTRLLISKEKTKMVLPVFFNILIAIELMETFNIYVKENSIKVQSILLIGLIAIGRKLLVLDLGHSSGMDNIGLAAIIIALSAGYYLIKTK